MYRGEIQDPSLSYYWLQHYELPSHAQSFAICTANTRHVIEVVFKVTGIFMGWKVEFRDKRHNDVVVTGLEG